MPDDPSPDPDAPVTDEEREAAEQLRKELDGRTAPSSAEAQLVESLRAAWEPRDLEAREHQALLSEALVRKPRGNGYRTTIDQRPRADRRTSALVRMRFGGVAAVALAASVLFALRGDDSATLIGGPPVLAVSRSTQPLFREHFAAAGGETDRIDRIAVARAADLRDNEFAKWGVR